MVLCIQSLWVFYIMIMLSTMRNRSFLFLCSLSLMSCEEDAGTSANLFRYYVQGFFFFFVLQKLLLEYIFMEELQRAVAQFYPSSSGGMYGGSCPPPPTDNYGDPESRFLTTKDMR